MNGFWDFFQKYKKDSFNGPAKEVLKTVVTNLAYVHPWGTWEILILCFTHCVSFKFLIIFIYSTSRPLEFTVYIILLLVLCVRSVKFLGTCYWFSKFKLGPTSSLFLFILPLNFFCSISSRLRFFQIIRGFLSIYGQLRCPLKRYKKTLYFIKDTTFIQVNNGSDWSKEWLEVIFLPTES